MPKNDHLNHTPDEEGIKRIEHLRRLVIELEETADDLCPAGRDLAVAKTKLEEFRMWAVKSIALLGKPNEID